MLSLSGCDKLLSLLPPVEITMSKSAGSAPAPTYPPDTWGTAKVAYATSVRQTSVAHWTAIALTPTIPRPTYPPYESPEPVDLPLGILPAPQLQMNPCECEFENVWRGRLNSGDYIEVYAGHFRNFPIVGMTMVTTRTPNYLGTTGWEFYYTPLEAGSVRVVSFDGLQVTLLSTNNTQFVFEAETRTWLSPPVTPITTVSP